MSTESTALVTIEMVETELAVLQNIKAEDLFIEATITPILDNIEKYVRSIPQDISTAKGRQEIISLAAKVCSTKTFIDGVRMKLTEGWRTQTATVNASGKKSKERLQKLQDETRAPMSEWENVEKERVAKMEAALSEIVGAGPHSLTNWQTLTVDAMKDRLFEIGNDSTDWQDYERRAQAAIALACEQIGEAISKREKYDAEQAELAQLRKAAAERAAADELARVEKSRLEREEAIATRARVEAEEKAARDKVAAEVEAERQRVAIQEKAKADAARAAQAQQEAEARAIQAESDRLAAQLKAEQARIAAEAKAKQDIADALEAKRLQDEATAEAERRAQEKRESNKAHRGKVDREIVAALANLGYDETTSTALIAAIVKGDVVHVRIDY
jgi:hypothetical protein